MSLKDCKIKKLYNSDKDRILTDFYIPVLSQSFEYYRLAGYFSSNSLAIAAKGIAGLIKNQGQIHLICNVVLSNDDYQILSEVNSPEFIERTEEDFLSDLNSLEDELKKDHIRMLGWMLKNGKLDMKIAFVPDGIYHQKIGILQDNDNNIVVFDGSGNETKSGWLYNIEQFNVFCSWVPGDDERIPNYLELYQEFWNGATKRAKIFSITDALKENLIKDAPKDDDEFEKLSKHVVEELLRELDQGTNSLKLREYQKIAVQNWFDNNQQGILEMATGTGKTECAISILQRTLHNKKKPILIIIAAFGQSLVEQWITRLGNHKIRASGASSAFSKWDEILYKNILRLKIDVLPFFVIVTTYQTFSSDRFIKLMNKWDGDVLLICDEMHHAGAPIFQKGLLSHFNLRLGLSATPTRWFDDEGNTLLNDFFGSIVFSFPMSKAMRENNPDTCKPFLCHYSYNPNFISLNGDENEQFLALTKKIAKMIQYQKNHGASDTALSNLLFKRADIVKNASQKMEVFERIIRENPENFDHTIIFCSGKQMPTIKNILHKFKLVFIEFTQHTTFEEREKILNLFTKGYKKGGYDIILAIDCLNEGIDIPSAKTGFFMENSQNPIEFIQRRGRLLRPDIFKNHATFYDFIALPSFSDLKDDHFDLERKELQKEFNRYYEFARLADNKMDCISKIKNLINEYALIIPNDNEVGL